MEYNIRLKVVAYTDVTIEADSAEDAQETAESLYVDEIVDELTDFEPFEIMECIEIA